MVIPCVESLFQLSSLPRNACPVCAGITVQFAAESVSSLVRNTQAALVQTQLQADPFSGHVFVFRGRRGDRIKVLWWDGDGLCLFAKRLEYGRFVWPQVAQGAVALTPAQLSMLLEGIDWRHPLRTAPKRAS